MLTLEVLSKLILSAEIRSKLLVRENITESVRTSLSPEPKTRLQLSIYEL